MRIETEHLIIRDLEISDEKPFIAMAQDGSLKDVGFDRGYDKWMGEWITQSKKLTDKDDPTIDYLAYTIQQKQSQIVIGAVGCSYYEDLKKVGITYFVGANYRNQGYATKAVKAYLHYFFEHYDISEIIATVREENIASWKVIEKAGFKLVETKMYKDVNDDLEEMYRFYVLNK